MPIDNGFLISYLCCPISFIHLLKFRNYGKRIDSRCGRKNAYRHGNRDDPRFAIQNWMRNRNTLEFLGLWESLHNPSFNRVQFDTFRIEAGLNRFVMTPSKWIETTGAIGIATIQQLLVLANMESYNALLIDQKCPQQERLQALRKLAIKQLQTLASLDITNLPQLPEV